MNIKVKILTLLALTIFIAGFAINAKAGFNEKLNYQGKLANSAGVAVPDGYYCMKFVIYDALTDGNVLWSEEWKTDNAHKVYAVSGLFSIMLGTQTSVSLVNFDSDSRYLEVQLDSTCNDSYEEVFTPRKQFGTVPAAFEAKQLGGFTWASPGAIGSATPSTGAFTTLAATTLTTTNPLGITYGGTGQAWNAVATGSMPYFNGKGTMSTLTAATSGWVLTANGANTAPSWTANVKE